MIAQIGIAICGVTAVFLSQSKSERLRRYACLFGLAGQPFWIAATIRAEQWGILALTLLYTFSWAKGLWLHWIGPRVPDRNPLASRGYVTSEPHLSGYRVVIGFDNRDDADAAHEHIARIEPKAFVQP